MRKIEKKLISELDLDLWEMPYLKDFQMVLSQIFPVLPHFKPNFYFGDEWFTLDQTISVSIPFWFSEKKLMKLEKEKMGFFEGESKEEFRKLLRHEIGHAFDHAYKLSKRPKFKKIFGDPKSPYFPDFYESTKKREDFVDHLEGGYAQVHPTEDFAETFAVIVDPQSNWRIKYKRRPVVLGKLLTVEKWIRHYSKKPMIVKTRTKAYHGKQMHLSLEDFYERRWEDRRISLDRSGHIGV